MTRTPHCILATGLAFSLPLCAQEEPKPVDMHNTSVGLGGGAGGKFGGRRGGRRRLARGAASVSKAIDEGLWWLTRHQEKDGGFDALRFVHRDETGKKVDAPGEGMGQVGITAICLLPFLGDGSTLRGGPHKKQIKSGVKWEDRHSSLQFRSAGCANPGILRQPDALRHPRTRPLHPAPCASPPTRTHPERRATPEPRPPRLRRLLES